MGLVKSKGFLAGVVVAVLLIKFGDRIPVAGPYLAKLK